MKFKITLLTTALLMFGCQSAPDQKTQSVDNFPVIEYDQGNNINAENRQTLSTVTMMNLLPENSRVLTEFPSIEYAKLDVLAGSQTLTAANKLADELGIEFVEWTKELNPYEFYQLRSRRIRLNFDDPQSAFLELFDRSGLLPVYDKSLNTVTVYPFSMAQRMSTPHIFTPKFDRSERQQEQFQKEYEQELVKQKKLLEYHYYKNFTPQQTINAWADHANFNGVIWFLDTDTYQDFLTEPLKKSDYNVGATILDVMNTFLTQEKERQAKESLPLTLVYEPSSKYLIVHPYAQNEVVRTMEIKPTSLKDNIERIGKFYGFHVSYEAPNYQIQTGYTTVLTRFIKNSIDVVAQQYPVTIEVIESSKNIIVKRDSK